MGVQFMDKMLNVKAYLSEPHLREMIRGSVVGLVVKVLAAVSLFAMNVVVTRYLGAAQAGLFFLGFTLVTIFATFGRLGLEQALVRFVATEFANRAFGCLHSVYSKAVFWTMIASAILTLGLWLGANLLNHWIFKLPGFAVVFKVMVLATPLMALFVLHAHALQGLKQVSKSMLVLSVFLPVQLLLLVLIFPTDGALQLSYYFLFSCATTLVIGVVLWRRVVPKASDTDVFSSALLRQTCAPLWAVAILHQVIQWSSQLLLGSWGSSEDVAFLATAQRTAMLTSFILFAVNTIAAPKFAAMHAAGDAKGLHKMAIMSVRMMLVVALPAVGFILVFPEWLMSMFGDEFVAAAPALMVLAIGQFINIATGSVGYLLSMTGNEKKVRDNVIISGAISISLGVMLIPDYGVMGAAIAYACGVASQNLLGVYQVKQQLGFNTLVFWRALD